MLDFKNSYPQAGDQNDHNVRKIMPDPQRRFATRLSSGFGIIDWIAAKMGIAQEIITTKSSQGKILSYNFHAIKLRQAIIFGVCLLLLILFLSSSIIFQMARLQKSALYDTQEIMNTRYTQAFAMYQAVLDMRFRISEIDKIVANAAGAGDSVTTNINNQIEFIRHDQEPIGNLAILLGNQRIELLRSGLEKTLEEYFKISLALGQERAAAKSNNAIAHPEYARTEEALSTLVNSTAITLSELAKDALSNASDDVSERIKDANSGATLSQSIIIAVNFILLVFTLMISVLLVRKVVTPIIAAVHDIDRVAQGDLSVSDSTKSRFFEMNLLRKSLQGLIETTRLARDLSEKQHAEEQQKESRRLKLEAAIADFRKKMSDLLELLHNRSENVHHAAEILQSAADNTRQSVLTASSSSAQTLSQITTVANAAVELDTSIRDIIKQVSRASTLSDDATLATNRADQTMGLLQDAVHKIGDVVDFIRDIAEQTNLLALNATIESARAGTAGLGFAVVAREVKQLSAQTTEATEIITKHIGGVEQATKDAFAAVQAVREMIQEVNRISATVVASVTQQGEATNHIAHNVESISILAGDVNHTVQQVRNNADVTANTASVMQSASDELSDGAVNLRHEVGNFLAAVAN